MISNKQNVETVKSSADKVKLTLAVIAVIAAIVAYYSFNTTSVQLGSFFGGLVVAILLVWWSDWGKSFLGFFRNSWHEMRRVTWPNRQTTVRMTAIVFAFSAIVGILLWLIDSIVGKLLSLFLGWGG